MVDRSRGAINEHFEPLRPFFAARFWCRFFMIFGGERAAYRKIQCTARALLAVYHVLQCLGWFRLMRILRFLCAKVYKIQHATLLPH